MDNSEIADLANKFTDASQVAGMEVVAVALILFAIGVIIGVLIFDVLSKRWHAGTILLNYGYHHCVWVWVPDLQSVSLRGALASRFME